MKMPETVQKLVREAREKNAKKAHGICLHRRRGKETKLETVASPYDLLDKEEAENVLKCWNGFHDGIPYQTFQEFYSKDAFCLSTSLYELGEEKLLDLIADRSFLYLEYNQHMNNVDCPSLYDVCSKPEVNDREEQTLEQCFEAGLESCRRENLSVIDPSETRAIEILEAAFQEIQKERGQPITHEIYGEAVWRRLDETRDDLRRSDVFPWLRKRFSLLFAYCRRNINAEIALQQGFLPTKAHRSAYREWMDHREELQKALERRREYLRRYGASPDERPKLHVESFVVPIQKERTDYGDLEKKLSILFHAYLEEAATHAYQKKYAEYVGRDPMEWVRETGSVLEYLDRSVPEADKALVFYHLFTSQTLKLARHGLRSYRFGLPKEAKKARLPIESVSGVISRRNICNIKLYDHLLWLFQPEDPDYAKFCFYAFTGFQWYTHFIRPKQKDGGLYKPTFRLEPDRADGVDELGHLLRRNIFFSFSSKFKWLTPDVNNTPEWDAETLVDLLLYDANIKASAFRLTNKIQRFLETKEGQEVLDQFSIDRWRSDREIVNLLDAVCEREGLTFRGEERMYECGKPKSKKHLVYSRYLLEFQLKEQIHAEGRRRLYQLAQKYFGNLFFSDDPFALG